MFLQHCWSVQRQSPTHDSYVGESEKKEKDWISDDERPCLVMLHYNDDEKDNKRQRHGNLDGERYVEVTRLLKFLGPS